MNDKVHWYYYPSAEEVAREAVKHILAKAEEAMARQGSFSLVLAGGTTPKRIYELLAEQPQPWDKWQLFLGDERCLPVDDPERNSLMVEQTWLNKVNFPSENFHPIPAELGPEEGARQYAEQIENYLPFNMVLLGMGEDGHTASLFPGHEHNPTELTHAVYHSPKPPPERVTLSHKALAQSEHTLILVTGSSKKTAVKQWLAGDPLPIARIRALNCVDVMLDPDARP